MIAQTLAARHPESVRSLVSIMSMTGNRWTRPAGVPDLPLPAARGPDRARGVHRAHVADVRDRSARPDCPQDPERIRDMMAPELRPRSRPRRFGPPARSDHRLRRPHCRGAPDQRAHARDPRIQGPDGEPVRRQGHREGHPRSAADGVEGMGHDLPEAAWPQIVPAIADHAHAADRARAAARRSARLDRILAHTAARRLLGGDPSARARGSRAAARPGSSGCPSGRAICASRPPLIELSDEQLSYLTAVDHHDHEALLALDPERDDAVGVARFVRVSDDVAECAIVVADEWQNRGLGGQLLDRLVERAREEDVERFTALVLAENTDALQAARTPRQTPSGIRRAHSSSSRSSCRRAPESSASAAARSSPRRRAAC